MSDRIEKNLVNDGIDRRGFLKCMAWAGTGMLWSVSGGVLSSRAFEADDAAVGAAAASADFSFVQVSDSHIGFSKEPNKDVVATFTTAVNRINALPTRPDLLLHTGDLTHLSKPAEFDTVAQVLKGAKCGESFYVPGEHDFFSDGGKAFKDRYGKNTKGTGWHSFDHKGVHFVGLVNVADLKPGGLGALGGDQIAWLKKDLEPLGTSTPVVVYAHVPLWTVYPKWGWGTDDSAQALALLKRFGAVTVLNGHIHQVLQKTEGNITFHTARSTAFPQPAPGEAQSPGPMKNVAADKLRSMLGLTSVKYVEKHGELAVVDTTLE
ncbi:MAG TPA: metallophosphoesterase [Tepidisphaeraceae bacterium]|jgi:3',5'-cyclic AMP phosphodiesterase CpdA|nr:metallophosphoesterase [Tepidisphaeraceae bacterium]